MRRKGLMPFLTPLKSPFPFLKEVFLESEPEENDRPENTQRCGRGTIVFWLIPENFHFLPRAHGEEGKSIHPLWWDIYNWFASTEQWREEGLKLLKGTFYQNREEPISKEISRRLYGEQ